MQGAEELTLIFHKNCRTEGGNDYLDLYRSPNREDHIQRFSGGVGESRTTFPQVRPPALLLLLLHLAVDAVC